MLISRNWPALLLTSLLTVVGLSALRAGAAPQASRPKAQDWSVPGGSAENRHYSSLQQINRNNVKQLKVAWSFDTGEQGGLQTSPLVVAGVLYGITPTQKIFAVDAATGKQLWTFESGIKGMQPDRERIAAAGFDDCLIKPISAAELRKRVGELLDRCRKGEGR